MQYRVCSFIIFNHAFRLAGGNFSQHLCFILWRSIAPYASEWEEGFVKVTHFGFSIGHLSRDTGSRSLLCNNNDSFQRCLHFRGLFASRCSQIIFPCEVSIPYVLPAINVFKYFKGVSDAIKQTIIIEVNKQYAKNKSRLMFESSDSSLSRLDLNAVEWL